MTESKRELFMYVVESWLGHWYSWGGDGPAGTDCSGLVVEGFKAIGIMARKSDNTAKGIYNTLARTGRSMSKPGPRGSLVFWCKNGDGSGIYHVEVVFAKIGQTVYTIGASGGGSKTVTKEDAIRDNAFVKIRPMTERGATLLFADPFVEE